MPDKKKLDTVGSDNYITLEGVITAVGVTTLKHGKPMAFVKVYCQDGAAELVFFPEVYHANDEAILEGARIKVRALPDSNDKGEVRYLVEEVI